MQKYTFYLPMLSDTTMLKCCPPSYSKQKQRDMFCKYLKYTNPIDHIGLRVLKFGEYPWNTVYCCFCTSINTYDLCRKCADALIIHVGKTIIQLSLPKMIDICIILRQLGLVDDIINIINNVIPTNIVFNFIMVLDNDIL